MKDRVKIIETNIDDMNPQIYGHVIELLLKNGALDAYLTPIIMKKTRPAIKITVICKQKEVQKLSNILFEETTTIGLRIFDADRLKLQRKIITVKTKYGPIRVKESGVGKTRKFTPEYEDCRKIAKQKRVPLIDVISAAKESANKL